MSDWIEVIVATDVDAAELLAALDDPDACGGWQEPGTVRLYWPAGRWRPELQERLAQLLGAFGVASPTWAVRGLPHCDWNATWAQTVQPLRIGGRLLVRPSWAPARSASGEEARIELILDPKQAFGTGHHATTRLLLEWLEELYTSHQGGRLVWDVGTGSGILAMAALRFGAVRAVGLDLDPTAIACAKETAAVNAFGQELELRVAALETLAPLFGDERPDLVLANLDRRTILASTRRLAALLAPAGRLLLSGLLVEDRVEVAAAFALTGLAVRRTREADGWVALELVTTEGCEG